MGFDQVPVARTYHESDRRRTGTATGSKRDQPSGRVPVSGRWMPPGWTGGAPAPPP
jgi:hypothetical protein